MWYLSGGSSHWKDIARTSVNFLYSNSFRVNFIKIKNKDKNTKVHWCKKISPLRLEGWGGDQNAHNLPLNS